jgi:hypothetical protein
MRLDARMSTRILIVLALALAACTIGQRSTNTRPMDPRTPYVFGGTGQDAAIDVVNGTITAAVAAAAQGDGPTPPLCTPENESGDPPHTCPEKAGEQPAPK